jgi:AhpD family alkylhydroperoxidase
MLMTARMTHPVFVLDGAMDALNAVNKSISRARLAVSRELVQLRAGQINGCSVCVDMHAKAARKSGESEERVYAVGAWRETPYVTDAERAALALTEAMTRLADRAEPVADAICGGRGCWAVAGVSGVHGRIGGTDDRAER